MKRRHLILAGFITVLLNFAQAQEKCHPVETTDPKGSIPITAEEVTRTGEYCLTHDIESPRIYVFSEGGERGFPDTTMLYIRASNVMFDLHGHSMNIEAHGMAGILSISKTDSEFQRNITIRNGVIKSRTSAGIQLKDEFNLTFPASLLSDFTDFYFKPRSPDNAELASRFASDEYRKLSKILPNTSEKYLPTRHLIEKIKIDANTLAIVLAGASNTIRNSTIELTDGHAAIYLFGPNQLIENNIIIFKGKAAVESAAAIKLHQADGTIIRNNDIIIESSGDDAPKAAISLIDSKNVVVEGNRIYGIKNLMHAWDDKSTIIDRSNEFRSMLRRPWASGQAGVR